MRRGAFSEPTPATPSERRATSGSPRRASAADLVLRATIKSLSAACAVPPTLQRADCRHRERLLLLLRSSPQRAGRKRRLRASAAPRASRRSGRTSALLTHDDLADNRARPAAAPCVRRRDKWRRRAKLGGVCCERRSSLSLLVADSLPDRSPQHEGTTVPKGVSRVAMESFPTEDRGRTAWLTSLEGLMRRRPSRRPPSSRRSPCHCFDSSSHQPAHERRL